MSAVRWLVCGELRVLGLELGGWRAAPG